MNNLYRGKDGPSLGQVGDVKQSMLTEAQFQEIHGATWTLMDGKSVTGSKYSEITGNNTLPDARGQFLRGKNNGRSDGDENPDGDLSIGAFQDDATAANGLETNVTGQHDHDPMKIGAGNGTLNVYTQGISSTPNSVANRNYNWLKDEGDHSHIISSTDPETRPKNITINYFIKID
jgi:hypothetical protein